MENCVLLPRRLREPGTAADEQLLDLIRRETEGAAVCLQLSRALRNEAGTKLETLYREKQANAACLSGIYALITGIHPHVSAPPIRAEPVVQMLRQCYGREMQCLARYEHQEGHPEYGKVFSRLASQAREHCRILLELLIP